MRVLRQCLAGKAAVFTLAVWAGCAVLRPAEAQAPTESAPPGAGADPAPIDAATARREELRALRGALAETEDERTATQAELEQLAADRAALNRQLIDTAAIIQDKEEAISRLEERLDHLTVQEAALRDALAERRAVLGQLLAALQRMGRNPPPALLVHPDDVLSAIRSAQLLGAVVPEVRSETEALIADLNQLATVRRDIAANRDALDTETDRLVSEQARLTLLSEIKRKQVEDGRADLAALGERATDLAGKVESLSALIGEMELEIARFQDIVSARAAYEAELAEDGGAADAEAMASYFDQLARKQAAQQEIEQAAVNPLVAQSDPNRIRPALPFSKARAMLPRPARGAVVTDFGDEDDFGYVSNGLSIATRRNAQVTAPSDGWIVYAGPFRTYGQLLIVDAGEGYHVVLAGMERIGVSVGQFVLAGEPVGVMGGDRVLVAASALTTGKSQPLLYVEFRKDGRAIDPAPWWAETNTKAGG